MHLTIETYLPLVLLLLIPFVWWAQRNTAVDWSARQLGIGGALRSGIICLLALALMQPIWLSFGKQVSVVYLVDVSQSVAPQSIQSAIQWIQQSILAGHPAHQRFIPFAANSLSLDSLDQLKQVPVASVSTAGAINRGATNIEDALNRAFLGFAPQYLKRLVLISDGNENNGHWANVLPRLKKYGVRVYTRVAAERRDGDAWIEAVTGPQQIPAGQEFPLEVRIYSQQDADGEVEVQTQGRILGLRHVRLRQGLNRIAFETQLMEPLGPAMLEASVSADGDPCGENNRLRIPMVVEERPKILYVEGHAESAHYLAEALLQDGLDIQYVPPVELPDAPEQLDNYDAIIFSDVSRNDITDGQMSALASYVRDLGGGFLLAGGENIYGQGGYSKTAIEEILPVTFETKKEKPDALALIIILDKSGSMGGQKIQLAKEATKSPLKLLRDTDLFGVIAFDFNSYWIARLQPAINRGSITQAVSSILPGGDTNMYPSLNESYGALEHLPTHAKHVILLSDGYSVPNDYEELAKKMAGAKISVSTVAVGDGADRDLLANIANWGGGRSYFIKDAANVSEIFSQETQLAAGKALREEPFKPSVKRHVDMFKGIDLASAPPLLGYVATKPKPTAEVILDHTLPDKLSADPILARWHYGLGKTAVFSSDLKDRWAANWLQWRGYTKFWSQLTRSTMRIRNRERFDFRVERTDSEARMTLSAQKDNGQYWNQLRPRVEISGPERSKLIVDLLQVAPGGYEAKAPLPQKGVFIFRTMPNEAGRAARMVVDSYPEEYRFYPANLDMLREISESTGGTAEPAVPDIFDSHGEVTEFPIPLWPYCAGMALVFYWTDVLLRRIRIGGNRL